MSTAWLAARHLLAGGRRRIGYVAGPVRMLAVRQREAGARAALEEAGLELPAALARYGPWSEEWGREAAAGLVGEIRAGAVDAVFCASDEIGRGVADGLRDAGVRVPDDAALVGVDNWRPLATSCRPPLTTVDLQLEQIGRVAAQELLARIAGGNATGARLLPGRLVVRASSGRSTH